MFQICTIGTLGVKKHLFLIACNIKENFIILGKDALLHQIGNSDGIS